MYMIVTDCFVIFIFSIIACFVYIDMGNLALHVYIRNIEN